MKRRIAERSFSKVGKSIVLPYCTSQIFVFLFACVFPDGISAPLAALIRLGFLVWGAVLTFSVLSMCPRKKTLFTYIGENSVYVFVLHAIPLAVLRHANYQTKFIYGLTGVWGVLLVAILAVAAAVIMSSKPVRFLFKWLLEPFPVMEKIKSKIKNK